MTKQSSFWFAFAVVVVALAASILIWGLRPSDNDAAQRLGGICAAEAAIGAFMALLVLVVYTRETFLLRSTAEQQLEGSIQPVVLLELLTEESGLDQPLRLGALRLRNIGPGPAFNVTVAPICGADMDLMIPEIPLIEAKETLLVEGASIKYHGGSGKRGDFAMCILQDAIFKETFPSDPGVVINFRSVSGKPYRMSQMITRLKPHGVRTDFVKLQSL